MSRARPDQSCDMCESHTDVASLEVVWESEGPDPSGASAGFYLCTRCAAGLIEYVTGFKMVRMLDVMYKQRANAANVRPATAS